MYTFLFIILSLTVVPFATDGIRKTSEVFGFCSWLSHISIYLFEMLYTGEEDFLLCFLCKTSAGIIELHSSSQKPDSGKLHLLIFHRITPMCQICLLQSLWIIHSHSRHKYLQNYSFQLFDSKDFSDFSAQRTWKLCKLSKFTDDRGYPCGSICQNIMEDWRGGEL